MKRLLFFLLILCLIFSCTRHNRSIKHLDSNETQNYVAHGLAIPKIKEERTEQLIEHLGYTVSYNTDWLIPNWVAYSITEEKLYGTVERDKGFYEDPEINGYTATASDYRNSGYSRGHMAPAGDMKWDTQAMYESCYYSNICPQDKGLNNGVWRIIEEQVRKIAKNTDAMYIVCGPIVSQNFQTIGQNKVAVPFAFFKAILVFKNGEYECTAFVCNNADLDKDYLQYMISVDRLERLIDMDLFYNLPDSVENMIESQCLDIFK